MTCTHSTASAPTATSPTRCPPHPSTSQTCTPPTLHPPHPADVNYPNDVQRSVDTNGYVSDLVSNPTCTGNLTNFDATCSCRPYTLPNGDMNGQVCGGLNPI